MKKSTVGRAVIEIYEARYGIYVSLVTAMIISCIFIYVMSYFSEPFIYLSLAVAFLGNAFGIYIAFIEIGNANS